MTVFYLVRHAHADWTPDENRPLSAQGLADTGRVAEALRPYPITAIYSSPFRRAQQTVADLARQLNLPVHLEADLRERALGCYGAGEFFEAVKATWRDPSFAFLGGETNAAAQDRGLGAVRRLRERHPAEHVVLSTHGNLMALILQGFDHTVDYAFWKSLTMPDIYNVTVSQDGRVDFSRVWQEDGSWEPVVDGPGNYNRISPDVDEQ